MLDIMLPYSRNMVVATLAQCIHVLKDDRAHKTVALLQYYTYLISCWAYSNVTISPDSMQYYFILETGILKLYCIACTCSTRYSLVQQFKVAKHKTISFSSALFSYESVQKRVSKTCIQRRAMCLL